jgi:YidC/Oxa1 family membrane protein insertase
MNIKELLIPLSLALITTYAIHYFFFAPKQTKEDDHAFIAPKSKSPLNTEIDFIDERRTKPTELTPVTTSWGSIVFSTEGASINSLDFRRVVNGKEQDFRTIFPLADTQKEERSLLVAFQEETPYYYSLINKQEQPAYVEITYQATTSRAQVTKKFLVYKNLCKIDLQLTITPKKDQKIEPRIFYASPLLPTLPDDQISAIVLYGSDTFEKIGREKLREDQGWISPILFGTDDRYFVHALVNDANNFAQRAYYKFVDKKKLFSIVESSTISEPKTWTMTFYFGPKESDLMVPVDPRLERTLDYYGWFAPLAKFLLAILKWFYSYVHNYGFAIILLTILIKLILLPFTIRAERGMEQRMEMQKKLTYIQQKYKHDPELLAQERAELLRKHGMPGLGGCLPLLLQLPIFIALNRVLSNSIALYKTPMLWITDLSAKDPYYILPLIVGGAMLLQALFAQPQQRMSMIAMAIIFGAITASFPAGLSLYICVSTVLTVLQSALLRFMKWK